METTGFFKDTDIHAISDDLSEKMQHFIFELGMGIEFKAEEYNARLSQFRELENELRSNSLKNNSNTNFEKIAVQSLVLRKIQQTISFLEDVPKKYEMQKILIEFL